MKKLVIFLCLFLGCVSVKAQVFESRKDSLKDSLNIKKGVATWYSYKRGLFAASTKFKKGAKIRVINKANKKHVDVIINDYGPNSKKHPNRILDLDKVAFKKIASLKTGIINIIICPLVLD